MSATDYSLERGLPVSLDAERSILGAVLLDNSHWLEAARSLLPEHFSLDIHRRIYKRMSDLQNRNVPVDMLTLVEELKRHNEIDAAGVATVSDLITGVPDRPSIEHYVRIVRNKALLRGLINLAQNAIAEAIEHQDEAEEVVGRAEKAICQLTEEGMGAKPFVTLAEATPAAYEGMRTQCRNTITTSIPALDELTSGGFWQEEFEIIGGDPGSGKSALASQIAAENGSLGRKVALFSVEMKAGRIMRRLWCYDSGLFYSKLKRDPRSLSKEDQALLATTLNTVAEWPVLINDLSSLQPQKFAALARHAVLREKVELVILDHIQLMTSGMPGKDEVAKVVEVSAVLRQFAKDYCPVLALSQLSRQNKDQRGQKPTMRDLKGSSALEQDASVILMMWHPMGGDGKPTGEDEIIVAKNREGEPRVVPVTFEGSLMRFKPRVGGAQ